MAGNDYFVLLQKNFGLVFFTKLFLIRLHWRVFKHLRRVDVVNAYVNFRDIFTDVLWIIVLLGKPGAPELKVSY